MLQNLSFEADLIIVVNNVPFLLVAEEHYFVLNFREFQDLDAMLKMGEAFPASEPQPNLNAAPKTSSGGPLKKLNDVNTKIRELGIMVEIRVGNKTYVVLGGNSPKIKAAAIFGKIGSFFGR